MERISALAGTPTRLVDGCLIRFRILICGDALCMRWLRDVWIFFGCALVGLVFGARLRGYGNAVEGKGPGTVAGVRDDGA